MAVEPRDNDDDDLFSNASVPDGENFDLGDLDDDIMSDVASLDLGDLEEPDDDAENTSGIRDVLGWSEEVQIANLRKVISGDATELKRAAEAAEAENRRQQAEMAKINHERQMAKKKEELLEKRQKEEAGKGRGGRRKKVDEEDREITEQAEQELNEGLEADLFGGVAASGHEIEDPSVMDDELFRSEDGWSAVKTSAQAQNNSFRKAMRPVFRIAPPFAWMEREDMADGRNPLDRIYYMLPKQDGDNATFDELKETIDGHNETIVRHVHNKVTFGGTFADYKADISILVADDATYMLVKEAKNYKTGHAGSQEYIYALSGGKEYLADRIRVRENIYGHMLEARVRDVILGNDAASRSNVFDTKRYIGDTDIVDNEIDDDRAYAVNGPMNLHDSSRNTGNSDTKFGTALNTNAAYYMSDVRGIREAFGYVENRTNEDVDLAKKRHGLIKSSMDVLNTRKYGKQVLSGMRIRDGKMALSISCPGADITMSPDSGSVSTATSGSYTIRIHPGEQDETSYEGHVDFEKMTGKERSLFMHDLLVRSAVIANIPQSEDVEPALRASVDRILRDDLEAAIHELETRDVAPGVNGNQAEREANAPEVAM